MGPQPLIAGIEKPVSRLALGTAFYRIDNKDEWLDFLDAYREAGGTILDSGRIYGTSEEVIGHWMEARSTRDQVIVMTKCGHRTDGKLPAENFPDVVRDELTASLHALRTEYVDLYLLHRDNHEMPVGDILEPLNREIADGRVRAVGASNWEYRRLAEAHEYAVRHGMKGFAAVSNNLSLAQPTASFYPGLVSTDTVGECWHRETGISLIPWSSQARGFFTGQYIPQMRDDPALTSGKGFTSRMLTVYGTDENFERLRRARELGEQKGGYTAVEVALAWLLHKPFPLVPIVGPHTQEELASCVRALSLSLTVSEIAWLNLEVSFPG
jgi:aryl-alcohol dehydrogenase-like predicted oxidoreductase